MKRFPLELPKELHTEFLRCFPDYGERTLLLRKCIRRLIQKAKVVYEPVNLVADDALRSMRKGG